MHSLYDGIVNFLIRHGWLFVWVIFLATIGYALHEHREHSENVKTAKGCKKAKAISKLVLLWMIPLLTLIGAIASQMWADKTEQALNKLEIKTQETKKDIRDLLEAINPQVLQMVDKGNREIHVMIGQSHLVQLSTLAQRSDFTNCLRFKETSSVVMAGVGGRIGDFINDMSNTAMMTGCILFPTDSLKNPIEMKPYPHFVFSLFSTGRPLEKVDLTNDFLVTTKFDRTNKIPGILIVPLESGQSNAILNFEVFNNSQSAVAEDVAVAIAVPQSWECVPSDDWRVVTIDSLVSNSRTASGIIETNVMQSWAYDEIPRLLPGLGAELPPIQLNNPPSVLSRRIAMTLMVRAKDSPTEEINFALYTLPNSIFKNPSQKPFVAFGTNIHGDLIIPFPHDSLK